MKIKLEKFNIETDGSGDWTETRKVPSGFLLQYRIDYDDLATGADLDITGSVTGFVYVNHDNLGTADLQRLPRHATSDETGTASLYADTGEPVEDKMAISEEESLTVTVANGGSELASTLYLWILQVEDKN